VLAKLVPWLRAHERPGIDERDDVMAELVGRLCVEQADRLERVLAELARLRRDILALADDLPAIVRDQALHSRPAATWDTVAQHIAGRLREIIQLDRATPRTEHVYLSTSCRHATEPGQEHLHLRCSADRALDIEGHEFARRPGRCKFEHCQAPCVCPCHNL
jgi:hypothetical protein